MTKNDLTTDQNRILDFLANSPRKAREISETLSMEKPEVRDNLRHLIAHGHVKRAGHLYGLKGHTFERLAKPGSSVQSVGRARETRKKTTKGYNPGSRKNLIRKTVILNVMKDGRWRSRDEIAAETGIPYRQLECVIPDLREAGSIVKVGSEFRDPRAFGNIASARNADLIKVLAKPILERHISGHIGISSQATVQRLKNLEEQGLAISLSVFANETKSAQSTLRFWCASRSKKKLHDFAERMGLEEGAVIDPKILPRQRVNARTALKKTTSPETDAAEEITSSNPAP